MPMHHAIGDPMGGVSRRLGITPGGPGARSSTGPRGRLVVHRPIGYWRRLERHRRACRYSRAALDLRFRWVGRGDRSDWRYRHLGTVVVSAIFDAIRRLSNIIA